MNWIDILILVILSISVAVGIWRGFIHETLSLLAWVAAFVVARVFAPDVAHWLEQYIESQALILLLSWIIPFLSTFIIFNLFKLLLISLITLAGLRPIDRVLGAAFGAVKGALLITAAVLIIQLVLSQSGKAFESESKLLPHFQVVALWMLKTLDQETELNLDNVVARIGKALEDSSENIDIDKIKEQLGLSSKEMKAIIKNNDNVKVIKELLNNPDKLDELKKQLKSSENRDNCKDDDCV